MPREKRRIEVTLAVILAVAVGLVSDSSSQESGGAAGAAGAGDKARKPAPAPGAAPGIVPRKFDHAQHRGVTGAGGGKVVTDDNCSTCHGDHPRGELALPGRAGHQPCLAADCHARQFLGSSPRMKQRDPERYKSATAFCLGCHTSADGQPPPSHVKARADAVYRDNPAPGYHVEFDHYAHTQRARCRDCHVVDARTFELELATPGHAQCATCHTGQETASGEQPGAMAECSGCHAEPGPAAYFENRWKGSETRSCGSPGHLELARRRGAQPDAIPCFKHERAEHRFRRSDPLQCDSCHFMIGDKRRWGRNRYESVRDLKSHPLIHNDRDLAHKSCGESSACHKKDVSDSRGTANCRLCHSQKTIDSGLFGP